MFEDFNPALAALRQVALFARLPEPMLRDIAETLEPVNFQAHDVLARAGGLGEAVWVVVEGEIEVLLASGQGERVVERLQANALVDASLLMMGGTYTATFRAAQASALFRLNVGVFNTVVRRDAATWMQLATESMLELALASVAPAVFGGVSAEVMALASSGHRWQRLDKGQRLINQGALGADWYVVLSGELVGLQGEPQAAGMAASITGYIGRGDIAGELPLMTGQPQPAHLVASRDTWLMRFTKAEFGALFFDRVEAKQGVTRNWIRHLARSGPTEQPAIGMRIAVQPVSVGINTVAFVDELEQALSRLGLVFVLDLTFCEALNIIHEPDTLDADHVEWLRLSAWLERQARAGVRVILVGDAASPAWTQRIRRECDVCLHLGDGAGTPAQETRAVPSPITDGTSDTRANAGPVWWHTPQWLCLLHPASTERPVGTAAWLDSMDVAAHFHARAGHAGDFARLARHVSGCAVGLALSGGGGRGPAHAGAYSALLEAGLPVDFISGASAGSLMACLLAADQGGDTAARRAASGMGSGKNLFGDYTLPVIALLKTGRLRAAVRATFGEQMLEDSWIPCAVVTTNLTQARREVFTRGMIWRIALASSSPPAVTLPLKIGLDLHCDGGLVDNLPVDLLKSKGCRFTLASYTGSKQHLSLPGDEFPSAWEVMFDRLFRGGQNSKGVPNLVELLVASTTLASDAALPRIAAEVDLYLAADLDAFSVLDFSRGPDVVAAGYQHGVSVLAHQRQSAHPKDQALWALVAKFSVPLHEAAVQALADWAKARQVLP